MTPRAGLLLLCLSPVLACGDAGGNAVLQGRRTVDSAGGTVALGIESRAYRATALPASGRIAGRITFASDTTPPPTPGSLDTISASTGGRIACPAHRASSAPRPGVLVWVEGVDAGKPLPMVRRATLSIEECEFVPHVMAVPAGTTINLFSADRATYTTRFFREGAADPVAVAQTVDAGQVVPSEDVAKRAGMVEVRRTEQTWARGFVAVFDHPYFAVADASGGFTIDSLPAGTYTLKIWHDGMQHPAEQRVTVTPGGTGRVDLTLTQSGVTAPAAATPDTAVPPTTPPADRRPSR